MYSKILLRYAELVLKGKNRNIFIKQLENNITNLLKEKPQTSFDRMYLNYSKENLEKLQYIFGISSYSPVAVCTTNYQDIENTVLKLFKKNSKTFKVNARRNWKKFEFTSDEINRKIATKIFENFNDIKVDVRNPEILINIEVRNNHTYVFLESIKGIGGLPVGVQGKVLHFISGGIDSPVAAYLMMKRGVHIDFLSFVSPPHTDQKTLQKIDDLINVLNKYQGKTILFQNNYTDMMNYLGFVSDQSYKITLMRRSFYRIAEKIAVKGNYLALSNGENLGQVASQTLESMAIIGAPISMPVYKPLITFDKLEIIDIALKIGTYDISILRASETCELFAPKKPVIKPKKEIAEQLEQELNLIPQLEQELLNNIKIKKIK